MVRAPLHAEFRYIHEPLPAGDPAIPTLGHEPLVTTLQERLAHSHGGAFLITGFRGVGKSTLVLRALAQTAAGWGREEHLLLVHLNVARTMTADQLLFAVVRRMFEALDDSGLLPLLPPDILNSLVMAYTRTSLSFKQTQSDSSERGGTVGVGPGGGLLSGLAPTLSLTGRRTESQAMEAAFLAYSETDVEHDLLRIVGLLNGDGGRPRPAPRGLRRFGRRARQRGEARLRVHPVVVLDEVDKLTDSRDEAIAEFEELLGKLKNVLTMRGAHFLVVAGPDLHDRALRDGDRGNGVYESVFSWRAYVPCLWQAPRRLVEGLIDGSRLQAEDQGAHPDAGADPAPAPEANGGVDGGVGTDPALLDDLVRYFEFKARGVPRRLLHEFNALVAWDGGAPYMTLGPDDGARVRFYRELQEVVAAIDSGGTTRGIASLAIDEDRRRLGDYHVTDWALRSQGRPFTSADVTSATGDQRIDPLLQVTAVRVERVLRHLARGGVLVAVDTSVQITRFGQQDEGLLPSYRLSDEYRRALAGFARSNERERADQGVSWSEPVSVAGVGSAADAAFPISEVSVAGRFPLVGTLDDGRFEIRELIGHGGMGSVYLGRDRLTGDDVAIKMMHSRLAEDADMRRRFQREAEAGQRLHHLHIVQIRQLVTSGSGESALIMDLVDGPSLSAYVERRGPLPAEAVATLARHLGSALQAIDRAGLARIDLKPGNILLHPRRGAVVIDLGLARMTGTREDSITKRGVLVGTVGYMAPEHVSGGPFTIRTDLYTLGLVMIFALTGSTVWNSESTGDVAAVLYRIVNEDVPVDELPVSARLRALLRSITARDPGDRPTVPEFLAALDGTPEGQATEVPFTEG
ncbi:serine/threonine-protein kinase [Streptomyces sp. V4-01]|uniref:Serine/threonine-protein kinase n=1 Tax=Actinacidiphila polyblastidii TaxID=3110430 RepID=A0ABU7PL97_9ACTN|nr:serine/threonine-protein kinase [Streptomyces sp. V4-01]